MRTSPVIVISAMVLAAAIGFAAAWLHLLSPPSPPKPVTVLMRTMGNTDKDPL